MKFPLVNQLKDYTGAKFGSDLIAGFTVAVILIPQGMAYAMLAGLPPIYGLYAGLVPLLIYPLIGSSKQLSVGPVALVSLLVLAGLSKFAEPGTGKFIELALLTAFVAGTIQVLLSVLRLGFLINFLSHPVIVGFTSAAAVIISVSQLPQIFGVHISRPDSIYTVFQGLSENISGASMLSILIGVIAILVILLLKRISKSFPASLLVVIIGTVLTFHLNWTDLGVVVIQDVPAGLPGFHIPVFSFEDVINVLPLALVICLISFIESLAIAKSISAQHDHYPVRANQELLALGIAKITGSFFQAFPNTGSFVRSAVNNSAGAKTGMSSIIAAITVGITLLFFTHLFYYLPKAILAATVIAAVVGLINFKEALRLFRTDRKDFSVLITTFLLTIILGVQQGVLAGVILSIGYILYETSHAHYAVLGKLPGTNSFRNIQRFPEAETDDSILIFRFDASLYFGNAEFFYEKLKDEIEIKMPKLEAVILDGSGILDIDTTGMDQLKLIIQELQADDISFYITEVIGPVRDILEIAGIRQLIGEENQFLSTNNAIRWLSEEGKRQEHKKDYANQFN